jgi:hypothetical protein
MLRLPGYGAVAAGKIGYAAACLASAVAPNAKYGIPCVY